MSARFESAWWLCSESEVCWGDMGCRESIERTGSLVEKEGERGRKKVENTASWFRRSKQVVETETY